MSLNSQKILGIRVTTEKKEIILEEVKKWLDKPVGNPHIIVTPNPEQMVFAKQDAPFAEILNQADVAIPDGIGLAWAVGVPRIPGVEFMEDLVQLAAKRGVAIGLIGGNPGVAVRALECLQTKYPKLRGWAYDPGLVSLSHVVDLSTLRDLRERIQKTNTRMVFVGLGAPKQEYFIERIKRHVSDIKRNSSTRQQMTRDTLTDDPALILMSVGGSFDILSGTIQRAPFFIRKVGMEWLWRLVHEPWRWKRQLVLIKFVWLVAHEKLASKGLAF